MAAESVDLTAIRLNYLQTVELPEITLADGPSVTQLALWLGFIGQGRLPIPTLRTQQLVPLDFLHTSTDISDSTPVVDGIKFMKHHHYSAANYLRAKAYNAIILDKLTPRPTRRSGERPSIVYRYFADRLGSDFRDWLAGWGQTA